MKTFSSTMLLVCLLGGPLCLAQQAKPASSNIPGRSYPQVDDHRRAIFRIQAPEVETLQVDLGRRYDMVKDAQGVWTVTTEPLDPGFHYYQLVIDGVRASDPASQTFYGTGRMSSGIDIPEPGVDFHLIRDVPHGDLRCLRYHSRRTRSWRRFYLYTPPGYDTDTNRRYPVLYLQHGAGEDDSGWGNQGRLDIIMDNLIAEGKTQPMLVVMTNEYIIDDIGRGYNTESTNRFMDIFKDELIDTIIPHVEKHLRVKNDRTHRAVAGLSMGGGIAFRIGMLNPDRFAWVGVFSSSAFRGQGGNIFDAEKQIPGILTEPQKFNESLELLYISTGQQDHSFQYTEKTVATFREHGLKVEYATFPGAHEWHVWRKALHDFAPRLFQEL